MRIKNRAVNRVKLNTLKQDKGEPIRRFAGRIRSLATVSEYTLQCSTCKNDVSYTDEVIKDQVIAGIADLEIQKDVLSHENVKEFTLEKLLLFIEGKEAGHASLNLMSGQSAPEVSKVDARDKKCRYCGDNHTPGKNNCKAAGNKCEKCDKMGHFAKVCRSKAKAQKKKSADSKAGEKSGDAIDAANWVCAVSSYESEPNKSFYCYDSSSLKERPGVLMSIIRMLVGSVILSTHCPSPKHHRPAVRSYIISKELYHRSDSVFA